ncbi:MAG: hypothetical protein NUW01_15860, partial [Gemmatimonadaceae bacterium]|nr:hypothetical protein [Gemmatimonadaceae bacterium]
PNGQPIQSGGGEQMNRLRETGGAPEEPQGSSVGQQTSGRGSSGGGPAGRNAARSRGGQQPRQQGSPVGGNGATP